MSLRQAVLPFCLAAALPGLVSSCQPYTTRPSFGPLPSAAEAGRGDRIDRLRREAKAHDAAGKKDAEVEKDGEGE